jgi:hypothetical protein
MKSSCGDRTNTPHQSALLTHSLTSWHQSRSTNRIHSRKVVRAPCHNDPDAVETAAVEGALRQPATVTLFMTSPTPDHSTTPSAQQASQARRLAPPRRKSIAGGRKRMSSRTRSLASVWALVAGVALAGAVSSSLSSDGRDRFAALFDAGDDATTDLAQSERMPSSQVSGTNPPAWELTQDTRQQGTTGLAGPQGAPMVTGSTGDSAVAEQPMAFSDITALSAEVARLRSENRMLKIERESLRGRLAAAGTPATTAGLPTPALGAARQSAAIRQPSPNITVRSMPLDTATWPGGIAPLGAPEDAIRSSLQRALAADRAQAADLQPVSATRFAINIGSGRTLGEVRGRWQAFSSTYPDIAAGLTPAVSVVEQEDGTTRLHLLGGPLPNAADAVTLCARLRNAGVLCTTSVFDGQRLASQ